MDCIMTNETAKNCGISDRMLVCLCPGGQIRETDKIGNAWLVPLIRKNQLTEGIKPVKQRMVKTSETDIFG